jgi:hypothetical protein
MAVKTPGEEEHWRQLEANLEAFNRELPQLLREHEHEFALLHDARIIWVFSTAGEAFKMGMADFGKGRFSVQRVDRAPANLGIHSYAMHRQHSA